jgi:hypothetical protein
MHRFAEEAGTDPLTITRKGINKDLEVISVNILEDQAKAVLSKGVYVFIAHGNGEQNRAATTALLLPPLPARR